MGKSTGSHYNMVGTSRREEDAKQNIIPGDFSMAIS